MGSLFEGSRLASGRFDDVPAEDEEDITKTMKKHRAWAAATAPASIPTPADLEAREPGGRHRRPRRRGGRDLGNPRGVRGVDP